MKKFTFYACALLSLAGSVQADFCNTAEQCMDELTEQQEECGQAPKKTVAQRLWKHRFKIAATGVVLLVIACVYRHRLAALCNRNDVVQDLGREIKKSEDVVNVLKDVVQPLQELQSVATVMVPSTPQPQPLEVPVQVIAPPVQDAHEAIGNAFWGYADQAKQKGSAYLKAATEYWKRSVIDSE